MKYGVAVASPRAAIKSALNISFVLKMAFNCRHHTPAMWIHQAHDRTADSQARLLDPRERYMARIIRWRTIEDAEMPGIKRQRASC
jgi:hypothetical protein